MSLSRNGRFWNLFEKPHSRRLRGGWKTIEPMALWCRLALRGTEPRNTEKAGDARDVERPRADAEIAPRAAPRALRIAEADVERPRNERNGAESERRLEHPRLVPVFEPPPVSSGKIFHQYLVVRVGSIHVIALDASFVVEETSCNELVHIDG